MEEQNRNIQLKGSKMKVEMTVKWTTVDADCSKESDVSINYEPGVPLLEQVKRAVFVQDVRECTEARTMTVLDVPGDVELLEIIVRRLIMY